MTESFAQPAHETVDVAPLVCVRLASTSPGNAQPAQHGEHAQRRVRRGCGNGILLDRFFPSALANETVAEREPRGEVGRVDRQDTLQRLGLSLVIAKALL